MEDILLLRMASHSISQCCGGAAAERGQQGRGRNGTLTPRTSQTEAVCSSPVQLISADPRSKVGRRVKTHFNGDGMSVLKLQMTEILWADHKAGESFER
ncbi:hypothetical protein VZT92_003739 [Zoarces viviparus]|uniref:Uncharacterized protein n=1 Tax=Zoarces viviparus TaxID=48416 RepID=A0AAW1FUE4_ZOAVI